MKYMGSKARIAKEILPIILKDRKPNQWYVEPFVGGCNMIDKVDGLRIGSDINYYLIKFFKALQQNWVPPINVTKDLYYKVKNDTDSYSPELVGYIGFCCSYSGKWFGGYAGVTKTKINTIRDYIKEANKNILSQSINLKGIKLFCCSYTQLEIPQNSIIYCDIPYKGTTEYKNKFDYDKFYVWAINQKTNGNNVFISEYAMPSDFTCIWEKEVNSSLSANGKIGGNKQSVERLFTIA